MESILTDEQIERFLNGDCSAEEYAYIVRIAEQDPTYQYLLKNWEQTDPKSFLAADVSKRMLNNIKQMTPYQKSGRMWIAAASIVLILLSTVVYYMLQPVKNINQVAKLESKNASNTSWRTLSNDSIEIATYLLPDSSIVKLHKGGAVKYEEGFGTALPKRSIHMKGKVFFEVVKNTDRPFTVYTGTVSTTALGTSFMVEEKSGSVWVVLYTGKVQLKKEVDSLRGWTGDIFLTPGQKMNYDKTNGYCKIVANKKLDSNFSSLKKPVKSEGFTLFFNNTSLSEVMDSLVVKYKVPIQYNKNEISERYFSGNIKSTDSLSVILKLIGQLNGLEISPDGKGYKIIAKQE